MDLLLVEDDIDLQKVLAQYLELSGFNVNTANHGKHGLQIFKDRQIDLCSLDVMMPVMDGFDFLVQFRARADCAATTVIVVTAKDLNDDDRSRLSGGVELIVEKSALTPTDLLEHVHRLLGHPSGVASDDGSG